MFLSLLSSERELGNTRILHQKFLSRPGARIFCPDHPDANLIEDYRAGDMICPQCGLVVGDRCVALSFEDLGIDSDFGLNLRA